VRSTSICFLAGRPTVAHPACRLGPDSLQPGCRAARRRRSPALDHVSRRISHPAPAPQRTPARISLRSQSRRWRSPSRSAPCARARRSLAGLERERQFHDGRLPAGATCDLGKMQPFDPGSGGVYVRELPRLLPRACWTGKVERGEGRGQAFDAVRTRIATAACRRAWSSRDGSQPDPNVTEVSGATKSPADAKRSMDASSYLYPVGITGRNGPMAGEPTNPPGWRVTLNFPEGSRCRPRPARS